MTDWIVRMDVWPSPSIHTKEYDFDAVGGKHRTFNVEGEEILDAHHEAELIITGIKTNPRVWRCHITAIEKTRR